MDLTAIRAGLAANLASIDGFRVYSEWPDNPVVPCGCWRPGDPYVRRISFGPAGINEVRFVLDVLVSTNPDGARAQQRLDALLSEDLPDAIESDRTLGGVADSVEWEETSGLREIPAAGVSHMGHEVSVVVVARRSS